MKDIVAGTIAGVIGGIFTGYCISWIQLRFFWKDQKILELKYRILDEAANAIAIYEREALDACIQSDIVKTENVNFGNHSRKIKLNYESEIFIRKILVKTKALFSRELRGRCLLFFYYCSRC